MNELFQTGKVTLLGAGPGDLELLTLKAVKALACADVLLIDDLVNPDIVQFAPRARAIKVGKRGGCKSTPQDFIQRLARRHAQQGKHVVRVKGGEALLFGRAGEEIAYLRKHGIAIDVINGISSAFAAAASLQLSLTHRTHAQGLTFVTAHKQDDSEPDWKALAAIGTTLVIYMGMSRITQIASGLLEGLPANTPAAVVQAASSEHERHLITTLSHLANDAAQAGMGSPAVIIVGKVLNNINSCEFSNLVLVA